MRDLDYGVKLITRSEWNARNPRSVTPLNPSFGATRHWEGPHMGYPWPHESCAPKVRGIQNFHMDSRGWSDIAYTGVCCPHGYVFEGRSLWVRTAANGTTTGNDSAYAFCYLGGELDPFTEDGKRAMKAAMNWTRQWGGAGSGRNDHNDWKATVCPGNVIEVWGDGGEPITWEPEPEPEEDMPAITMAVDTRDGAHYQVLNFETATWLGDDYAVWITAVYWDAHGVPGLAPENWDPRDLDRVLSNPGSRPAPGWSGGG